MSAGEQSQEQAAAQQTEEKGDLLADCINATFAEPEKREEGRDLIENLVEKAMQGVIKWDRNVSRSINMGIAAIDEALSKQLSAIMHNEKFSKLEGSWRGLNTLVMNTTTGKDIKIKVLNCSKDTLKKDLSQAVEFDQSELFKQIYAMLKLSSVPATHAWRILVS